MANSIVLSDIRVASVLIGRLSIVTGRIPLFKSLKNPDLRQVGAGLQQVCDQLTTFRRPARSRPTCRDRSSSSATG